VVEKLDRNALVELRRPCGNGSEHLGRRFELGEIVILSPDILRDQLEELVPLQNPIFLHRLRHVGARLADGRDIFVALGIVGRRRR